MHMDAVFIEEGIINLMLPFRFNKDLFSPEFKGNKLWERAPEKNKPGLDDAFLEHVREFLTINYKEGKTDKSSCVVFGLKEGTVPFRLFAKNKVYLMSRKSFDKIEQLDSSFKLPISFDSSSFKLILHYDSGIAILHYMVKLEKTKTDSQACLHDFIVMNYMLRLFNRQDEVYFISKNNNVTERGKASDLSDVEGVDIEIKGWRPSHLVNYLLNDIINIQSSVKKHSSFFHSSRFIPFSYVRTASPIIDENIINTALFHLKNVYDFDYSPSSHAIKFSEDRTHPFQQIYYASSVEGSVIFNNSGNTDPEFIKVFYNTSFQKNLWVIILGLLQRSIMLQLMTNVSEISPDNHKKIKEYLRSYARISLKALFSKISVYHQYNDFYDHIKSELQILELQTELKEELSELNSLQTQFHDEEEKIYGKRLNVIITFLSVLSLAQVTYAILSNTSMPLMYHFFAIGIPVLVGIISWLILVRPDKKLSSSRKK